MKLHLDGAATRISSYGPGYFAIGERVVRRSIIISADGAVTPWPPVVPSDLEEEHLRPNHCVQARGGPARNRRPPDVPAPGAPPPFRGERPCRRGHGHARRLPHVQRARGREPRGRGGPSSHRLARRLGTGARQTFPAPAPGLSLAAAGTSAGSTACRLAAPRSEASPGRRPCSPSRRSSDRPEPSGLPSRASDRCERRQ